MSLEQMSLDPKSQALNERVNPTLKAIMQQQQQQKRSLSTLSHPITSNFLRHLNFGKNEKEEMFGGRFGETLDVRN